MERYCFLQEVSTGINTSFHSLYSLYSSYIQRLSISHPSISWRYPYPDSTAHIFFLKQQGCKLCITVYESMPSYLQTDNVQCLNNYIYFINTFLLLWLVVVSKICWLNTFNKIHVEGIPCKVDLDEGGAHLACTPSF